VVVTWLSKAVRARTVLPCFFSSCGEVEPWVALRFAWHVNPAWRRVAVVERQIGTAMKHDGVRLATVWV
jgi:hypothetical protein